MILFLSLLFLQDAPVATDAEAAKLVRQIASKPDVYQQCCSALLRDDAVEVKVSAYGLTSRSEHAVSAAQFEALRKVRDQAIKALVAWLDAGAKPCEDDEMAWVQPGRHKLAMLIDLNATAALPALGRLAERLSKSIADAGPDLDEEQLEKLRKDQREAYYAKAVAATRYSDVLSTIVAILRQEKFAPLLASSLEKETQAAIESAMKQGWLADLREKVRTNGGVVAQADRSHVGLDPVSGVALTAYAYPKLKAGPETARQIIAWTADYAKLEAGKRLDAKGMSAWPVVR